MDQHACHANDFKIPNLVSPQNMNTNLYQWLVGKLANRKPRLTQADVVAFEEELSELTWEYRWQMLSVTGIRLGPQYVDGLRQYSASYSRTDDGAEFLYSLPLFRGASWELTILSTR